MLELKKVENDYFKNYYEGTKGDRKVVVILDTNCKRYIISRKGKRVVRREYQNHISDNYILERATILLNK